VRLGVAWQATLLYAKVGESWGNFNYRDGCSLCPSTIYSGRETRPARIAGAGVEYAVLHNVALKVEYDYLEFGQTTLPFFGNAGDTFKQGIVNRASALHAPRLQLGGPLSADQPFCGGSKCIPRFGQDAHVGLDRARKLGTFGTVAQLGKLRRGIGDLALDLLQRIADGLNSVARITDDTIATSRRGRIVKIGIEQSLAPFICCRSERGMGPIKCLFDHISPGREIR
jgi:OmpA-like transmembrane domain